ncbi:hypothetical protein TD95_001306 [Thielaviopsis punctulata]|uniref:Peptidase M48 domain-containing protein n=1 Tax=Thielaviopsis punctulata TaxID=72032 RepID=A0A0F4ZM77_9PEZI|nr:hypothetical protein TD95_001306 [Thielaviopsis punctulata]
MLARPIFRQAYRLGSRTPLSTPSPLFSPRLLRLYRRPGGPPMDPNQRPDDPPEEIVLTPTQRAQMLQHYKLAHAKPLFTYERARSTARSPVTWTFVACCAGAAVVFYAANTQTVPVSGRRRFNCYGDGGGAIVEEQVRRIEYEVESQGGSFLPEWDPRTRMVRRVMNRLIPVSGMPDKEWEVRVIHDPNTLNAFVLPGGKVFVFDGIFRVTRSEDGLAAVLGHEIAHNIAQHFGERQSSAMGTNMLMYSLLAMSYVIPPLFFAAAWFLPGMLDMMFQMPMSRVQESEADYIGLMIMAEACYDPRAAVEFWKRMDYVAKRNHEETPEWASTHPSNENRIRKITEWLPKAMEKWEQSDCKGHTSAFANMFMDALNRGILVQL